MNNDPISLMLDKLIEFDEVYGCMIARYNLISVLPVKNEFKEELLDSWDLIKEIINEVLNIVHNHPYNGISEFECLLMDFKIIFYVFPDTENALVSIVSKKYDKQIIEEKMQSIRNEVLKII